jgi:lipopolysaccharide export system permease protein
MINALDRYILRRIIALALPMVGVALLALLLERLLRLLELADNPNQVLSYLSQMLITLIPHYLGVALPLAFFLGVLFTFNRLNRDNELAVMAAAGISLQRLMMPVLGLALALAVFAVLTFSYLQPLGRYTYRSLVHTVAQASLTAAVKEGTFIHVDGLTFIAERSAPGGNHLDKVFVYDSKKDGGALVTTAEEGNLRGVEGSFDSVLVLGDGRRTEFKPNDGGARTLLFDHFTWPIESGANEGFRARGEDERELTLPELWSLADAPPAGIERNEIISELHGRLTKMATILVLPLLAVPLALGGGRGGQSYGIGVGLLVLIVYEKLLQFGESMVEDGHFSPWLGLWLPFGIFTLLSCYLFYRAAMKIPKGGFSALPAPSLLFLRLAQRFRFEGRSAT